MSTSSKSRAVALVLAFLLGGVGIHRFYVGRVISGAVMLVLTITILGILITFFWVWIDIIRIAAGTFTDKEGAAITKW